MKLIYHKIKLYNQVFCTFVKFKQWTRITPQKPLINDIKNVLYNALSTVGTKHQNATIYYTS